MDQKPPIHPTGPVIAVINRGDAYWGDATILGKPYVTGYDPIRDAASKVIGIYYVGFPKRSLVRVSGRRFAGAELLL